MPNTLAHIGIQGLTTRSIIRTADLKWVYLGCIIPDIPWISQRLINALPFNFNPYDLRLYAIVQASFFFCLLLSLAFAAIFQNFWKIFAILSINSFLHLLLDALQTKWANGVHLFAPLGWKLTNFDLFWMESFPTYILTLLGLVFFAFSWRKCIVYREKLTVSPFIRILTFILSIAAYLFLPFLLMNASEAANNHFVKTLRNYPLRAGQYIEIDRAHYRPSQTGGELITFGGEKIGAGGIELVRPATVSIRGTFTQNNHIKVSEYHVHALLFRNLASYIGLFLVATVWIVSFYTGGKQRKHQK